ncbi:hypothetical protein AB0K68_35260 [Streptomyces sp. NPDC050698]
MALRPGEQVQVDTTRLDVLADFDDGTTGRPELTIAVDVATRAGPACGLLRPEVPEGFEMNRRIGCPSTTSALHSL